MSAILSNHLVFRSWVVGALNSAVRAIDELVSLDNSTQIFPVSSVCQGCCEGWEDLVEAVQASWRLAGIDI